MIIIPDLHIKLKNIYYFVYSKRGVKVNNQYNE